MKVGDLVQTIAGNKHHGKVGIITHVIEPYDHNLWPADRLIEVMYAENDILTWSERTLEPIN